MASEYKADEEMEPASLDEEEPASDFDFAADTLAGEMGVEATPTFRSALKEAIHACMKQGYGDEEKPAGEKESGLALIFGSPKKKG